MTVLYQLLNAQERTIIVGKDGFHTWQNMRLPHNNRIKERSDTIGDSENVCYCESWTLLCMYTDVLLGVKIVTG